MEASVEEIGKYLEMLAETTARIASASRGVEDAQFQLKYEKTSWSANDILAHLRSCADVWGKSIQEMLARENPTLPYVHPRQWVKKTDYLQLDFRSSLRAFTSQRKELLILLTKLALADWERGATIKGRRHTVFTQARRMATHENEHCEKINALLKS